MVNGIDARAKGAFLMAWCALGAGGPAQAEAARAIADGSTRATVHITVSVMPRVRIVRADPNAIKIGGNAPRLLTELREPPKSGAPRLLLVVPD